MNAAGRAAGTRGFTLAEALVAAAAGGVVLAAAFGLLASFTRLGRVHLEGVRFHEAARVAELVLAAETRLAAPADLPQPAADTLAIRAARGLGLVCSLDGAVHVRYRGMRDPDPAKDSVLVLGWGAEPSLALESDRPADGACAPDPAARVRAWSLSEGAVPVGTPLLLYERGAYHLGDGALRYRRGAAGRQPLTEARLVGGGLRLGGEPPSIRLDLRAAATTVYLGQAAGVRARLWNW